MAAELNTETLDHEVRTFGICALLVEPSFTRTPIDRNEKTVSASLDAYADQEKRVNEIIRESIGDDPGAVAEVIYSALAKKSPALRHPVGQARAPSLMRCFVPSGMFDPVFRKKFRLDSPHNTGSRRGAGISEFCLTDDRYRGTSAEAE